MSGIINSVGARGGIVGSDDYPTGHVIQTVVDVKTVGTISMGNSTEIVTTGVASTITPKSASNKIFVLVTGGSGHNPYPSQELRSTIHSSVNGTLAGGALLEVIGGGTNTLSFSSHSMSGYDAPATTATVTYTLYAGNSNGSLADVYFNIVAQRITITMMEIAV